MTPLGNACVLCNVVASCWAQLLDSRMFANSSGSLYDCQETTQGADHVPLLKRTSEQEQSSMRLNLGNVLPLSFRPSRTICKPSGNASRQAQQSLHAQ